MFISTLGLTSVLTDAATTYDATGAWRIDVDGQLRSVPYAVGAVQL